MSPDDRRMLDRAEARMREAAGWTDGPRSPLTYQIAEMLQAIGWTSPCDAQWTHLESALPLLRDALYAKARSTREGERTGRPMRMHDCGGPIYRTKEHPDGWCPRCGAVPASPAAQQEREPLRFPCGCVSRLTPCEKHDRVLTSYDEPPEVTAARAVEREGCAADEMEHRDNYMAPNPPPLDTAPAPAAAPVEPGERRAKVADGIQRFGIEVWRQAVDLVDTWRREWSSEGASRPSHAALDELTFRIAITITDATPAPPAPARPAPSSGERERLVEAMAAGADSLRTSATMAGRRGWPVASTEAIKHAAVLEAAVRALVATTPLSPDAREVLRELVAAEDAYNAARQMHIYHPPVAHRLAAAWKAARAALNGGTADAES